ncbi:MAG: glycosyltransferase family 4 protein [Micavibrio aeruginosavorus]|uniref:Glycosyltransferase family 4 protein n=1 Tax=Micavibrio aeruginosavorus TaxID=349221 RepID=A0A2W4ZXS8_9BACT|nr:MAG: glycosyltransferase family 4 protein [Micavibrio aeruginosavorus]
MKILFTVKALVGITGGAERVLCDVASGLAEKGHDIAVLSFDKTGGEPFYSLSPSVRRITCGIGDTMKRATAFETLSRMAAIRKAVKAENPDAVVAFMHSMFIPTAFALIGTGIPVVGSEHIVPDHYKNRQTEYWLLIASSFFMKKITVLSEQIASSYPWPVRRKMVPIPNPVAIPDMLSDRMGTTILNIGRLEEQKDQETLIRAFSLLAEDYPAWNVRIMGAGTLKEDLQSLIEDLGLAERVVLGGITRNIGAEYAAASIFALPSRYESFGLATAEAMAYALPVIGFADCPGTNELISHDENGILVSGQNRIAAFEGGLRILLQSGDYRIRIGNNARQIIKKYDIACIVKSWEKLIALTLSK